MIERNIYKILLWNLESKIFFSSLQPLTSGSYVRSIFSLINAFLCFSQGGTQLPSQ